MADRHVEWLHREGVPVWMDGGFHADYTTKLPFTKPQIYPNNRAFRSLPLEERKRHAHECLRHNTVHAFFRARAEHAFSRSRLGRFNVFKNFTKDVDLVAPLFRCCCVAENIIIMQRHGAKGIYELVDAETVRLKAEEHYMQSKRYPAPW